MVFSWRTYLSNFSKNARQEKATNMAKSLSPGRTTVAGVLGGRIFSARMRAISSRSFALRALASGAWHLKQVSEKIGNTSRLKSGAAIAATGNSKIMMSPMHGITGSLAQPHRLASQQNAQLILTACAGSYGRAGFTSCALFCRK